MSDSRFENDPILAMLPPVMLDPSAPPMDTAAAAPSIPNSDEVNQLCSYALLAKQKEVLQMLESNPGLLLQQGTGTDHLSRVYTGTVYQILLRVGHITFANTIQPYFTKLLGSEGEKERARQFDEEFPHGVTRQESYNVNSLLDVIIKSSDRDVQLALAKRPNETPLLVALIKFRSDFAKISMNVQSWYTLWPECSARWTENQRNLYFNQVLGWAERCLPFWYLTEMLAGSKQSLAVLIPEGDNSGLGYDFRWGFQPPSLSVQFNPALSRLDDDLQAYRSASSASIKAAQDWQNSIKQAIETQLGSYEAYQKERSLRRVNKEKKQIIKVLYDEIACVKLVRQDPITDNANCNDNQTIVAKLLAKYSSLCLENQRLEPAKGELVHVGGGRVGRTLNACRPKQFQPALPQDVVVESVMRTLPTESVMSLSATCRFFNSSLQVEKCFRYAMANNARGLLAMLKYNPQLLLAKYTLQGPAGRLFKDKTLFQVLIATSNWKLIELVKPFFNEISNGHLELQRQSAEQLPGQSNDPTSSLYKPSGSMQKKLSALMLAMRVAGPLELREIETGKANDNNPVWSLIKEFKAEFNALMQENCFNPLHVIDVYDQFAQNQFLLDERKKKIFFNQVVDFAQNFLPACYVGYRAPTLYAALAFHRQERTLLTRQAMTWEKLTFLSKLPTLQWAWF